MQSCEVYCNLKRHFFFTVSRFAGLSQQNSLVRILLELAQGHQTLNFQQQCSLPLLMRPHLWLKALNHHQPAIEIEHVRILAKKHIRQNCTFGLPVYLQFRIWSPYNLINKFGPPVL